MKVTVSPAWRSLVHRHHIRHGLSEETVVALRDVLQDRSQVGSLVAIQFGQGRQVETGHEGAPAVLADDQTLLPPLGQQVAVETAARPAMVTGKSATLPLKDRWHERIGIDLAMGVMQGDADLLASIFVNVDVAHVWQPAELQRAVGPDFDEIPDALHRLPAERGFVLSGVADHLAAPVLPGVGGEAVLEHCDLIVGKRDLRFQATRASRAERAELSRRLIGSILPPGRSGDPLALERMPAKLAQERS